MKRVLLLLLFAAPAGADTAVPGASARPASPPPTASDGCLDLPPANMAPADELVPMRAQATLLGDDDPRKPEQLLALARLEHGNARAALLRNPRDPDDAMGWVKTSIGTYRLVTDNPRFAGFAKRDAALAGLAHLLAVECRADLARPVWLKLIKEDPHSTYLPAAYASFGDYYFDANDLRPAISLYEKVQQFTGSACRTYALYKSALANRSLGDEKRALELLVAALRDRPSPSLAAAARHALVASYAKVGEPAKARKLFEMLDGAESRAMLLELAGEYGRLGKAGERDALLAHLR